MQHLVYHKIPPLLLYGLARILTLHVPRNYFEPESYSGAIRQQQAAQTAAPMGC